MERHESHTSFSSMKRTHEEEEEIEHLGLVNQSPTGGGGGETQLHSQVILEFRVREGGQKEKKCVNLCLVASVKRKFL